MFYFGDPSDNAKLLLDNVKMESTGPAYPEKDLSEMTEDEHRIAFTYYYITYHDARRDGASSEVLDVILAEYDRIFVALAERSEEFRLAVKQNRHQYITGYNKKTVSKYRKLAGLPSES